MLRPDTIDHEALSNVADDIGELIDAPAPSPLFDSPLTDEKLTTADSSSYDMTETFAVWMIDYDDLMVYSDKNASAYEMPKPIDRWHHQVRRGGKVTGYARSTSPTPDAGALRQLVGSQLAGSIDAAISLLDEFERTDPALAEGDWLVRLLVVPSYQIHAFWVVNEASRESKVLLIDAPARIEGVCRRVLVSLESFAELLRHTRPATGLASLL